MAFEMLSDKLQGLFKKIRGQSKLTEANMEEMLREIRFALIDADVNNEVVKKFLADVKEKMLGQQVLNKVSPGQMVVKIINDEIVELLGGSNEGIKFAPVGRPTIIMMVGLQGGGKTTAVSKIAYMLKNKQAKKPLLVACDIYRPAAIDQLEQLGKQIGVPVYSNRNSKDVVAISQEAYALARRENHDVILIDTAGRLAIDTVLMDELKALKEATNPNEILLVVDAMSGQDAVNVAKIFHEYLNVTGAVMTKLDGDARGGAALSIASISGIKIKFTGTGEKVTDLDVFHPERMANRILGMGDVVELVEKAQEQIDEQQAKKLANKMLSGKFDLQDMLMQIESTKKMGPLGSLAKLIPGMPKISDAQAAQAEARLKKTRVVIQSMTLEERRNPDLIKGSRKIRIANGCGLTNADVNFVLKQYEQQKQQMKQLSMMFRGRRPF